MPARFPRPARPAAAGLASALAAFAAAPAAADVIIDVYASSAPNIFGSPSWNGYLSNAMNALQNELSNVGGSRDTIPTAYEQLGGKFVPGDVMVTSFNSWRGVASPAAPFAAELGNRIHFGLLARGTDGMQFSLNQVSYNVTSSDSGNILGFAGNLAGTTLNGTTRIGVDYGTNGVWDNGGGDDILLVANQNDAFLMDALIYVGVGNAFWPTVPTDGPTGQDALNNF
ncbi:MAG: hypothetical protein AB7F67_20705, partial [Rhodospirillaceae bacterium]